MIPQKRLTRLLSDLLETSGRIASKEAMMSIGGTPPSTFLFLHGRARAALRLFSFAESVAGQGL
jgi:hypothetical protein